MCYSACCKELSYLLTTELLYLVKGYHTLYFGGLDAFILLYLGMIVTGYHIILLSEFTLCIFNLLVAKFIRVHYLL